VCRLKQELRPNVPKVGDRSDLGLAVFDHPNNTTESVERVELIVAVDSNRARSNRVTKGSLPDLVEGSRDWDLSFVVEPSREVGLRRYSVHVKV
jgi:hypothetical protein